MEAAFSATAVVGGFVDRALVPVRACPNCADVVWVSVTCVRRTRFRHALDALERGHAGDAGDRTEVDGLSYTERRTRPKADQHRRARYRGIGMSASAMRSALIGEHWRL